MNHQGNDESNDPLALAAKGNQDLEAAGVERDETPPVDPNLIARQNLKKEAPPKRRTKKPAAKKKAAVPSPDMAFEKSPEQEAAERFVTAFKESAAAKEEQEFEAEKAANVYYQQCDYRHVAFFYTGPARGAFRDTDFYATYKAPGQIWPSEEIPCQVCERPSRVWAAGSRRWVANRRFLKSMPKDKFEALMRGEEVAS